VRQLTFHSFTLGDVDDPEIYAAMPINEWEQTEQGQWVMEHCNDPMFRIQPDGASWGHRVIIYGLLDDKDATAFMLKWGKF
jgi:hypothetical protein